MSKQHKPFTASSVGDRAVEDRIGSGVGNSDLFRGSRLVPDLSMRVRQI